MLDEVDERVRRVRNLNRVVALPDLLDDLDDAVYLKRPISTIAGAESERTSA